MKSPRGRHDSQQELSRGDRALLQPTSLGAAVRWELRGLRDPRNCPAQVLRRRRVSVRVFSIRGAGTPVRWRRYPMYVPAADVPAASPLRAREWRLALGGRTWTAGQGGQPPDGLGQTGWWRLRPRSPEKPRGAAEWLRALRSFSTTPSGLGFAVVLPAGWAPTMDLDDSQRASREPPSKHQGLPGQDTHVHNLRSTFASHALAAARRRAHDLAEVMGTSIAVNQAPAAGALIYQGDEVDTRTLRDVEARLGEVPLAPSEHFKLASSNARMLGNDRFQKIPC